MRKSIRWSAAAGAAVALLLAGCSAGNGTTDPAQVEGEIEPRTITWLTARAETSSSVQTVRQIAEAYAADHPGFSLDIVTTPDRPSYLQRMETLAAAGELPELFDTDATPFAEKLRDGGTLVDVAALLDEIDATDKFRPQALDYQRFADDSLFMLPLEFDMEFFWYNTALFEEAGVAVPATLEDFPQMCTDLRAADITPIAVTGPEGWPLQRYLSFVPFRLDGNAYVESLRTGEVSMADDPGGQGVEWVASLGAADCFSPDFAAQSYTDARDQFTQGKAAVYYIGTWEMPVLLDDAELAPEVRGAIDYFTLPTADGATTAPEDFYFHSGIGLALNADRFDPLIKDFTQYLIDEYPAVYAETGQFSPIVGDVTSTVYDSELYAKLTAQLDQLGDTLVRPWDTMLDPTTNSRIQEDLPLLVQGDRSPADFESTIDAVITENAPSYFGE